MNNLRDNLPLLCPSCGNRDHGVPGVVCSGGCMALPCTYRMDLDLQCLVGWCYEQGWRRGVTDYAVWSDGEQFVGVMRRPLKDVLERGPDDRWASVDLAVDATQFPGKGGRHCE